MRRSLLVLLLVGLLLGFVPAGLASGASVAAAPLSPSQASRSAVAEQADVACVGCHPSAALAAPLAQVVDPIRPVDSLKKVAVPKPSNLSNFVQNETAALQLGKALFWDQQVGSDGIQACASCHFIGGADNRAQNQLSPGLNAGDTTFQVGAGPNYKVVAGDFPFTRHASEGDPAAALTSDKNDVMSSQGVFNTTFVDVTTTPKDNCTSPADPIFHVGKTNTRRVEPRNAPTVINAVFNFRNFWDGRANNNFNGVNPFGQRDPNAKVWKVDSASGNAVPVSVVIPLGSLASQAVGPPGSPFEMSCAGRSFAKLGKKLLTTTLPPLSLQLVHQDDSVLGTLARSRISPSLKGLNTNYTNMIKAAFNPQWWSAPNLITVDGQQYTQMQANFSLFFGLAVQIYEATLRADDSPVDKFFDGTGTLTPQQQNGLLVFEGNGKCIACHSGPETTNASVDNVRNQRIEQMIMGDGGCRIYDNGFYNIGARPTNDDIGVGGTDPFGNPLSETQMFLDGKLPEAGPPAQSPDCTSPTNVANVMGAFKTPGLRNVELTGPYFHNGGKATLMQVVNFYNRSGDFGNRNIANLDPDIQRLGLTDQEKTDLVAFLVALTDERVRWEKAPFDHPALCVPNGQTSKGAEQQICLAAVGKAGASTPVKGFLGLAPTQP